MKTAPLLSVLGDSTRLRVLRLVRRQELCVCELVDALQLPQYAISRHLGTLRAAGLVEARRSGRWIHYRLGGVARKTHLIGRILALLHREMGKLPTVAEDDARLARRLSLRHSGQCVVGTTRMPTSCRAGKDAAGRARDRERGGGRASRPRATSGAL